VELAPEALDRILDLAINAKQEKVRLQANLEILDRAGLGAPQKVEIAAVGLFGDAQPDDIIKMIRKNMEGAA